MSTKSFNNLLSAVDKADNVSTKEPYNTKPSYQYAIYYQSYLSSVEGGNVIHLIRFVNASNDFTHCVSECVRFPAERREIKLIGSILQDIQQFLTVVCCHYLSAYIIITLYLSVLPMVRLCKGTGHGEPVG